MAIAGIKIAVGQTGLRDDGRLVGITGVTQGARFVYQGDDGNRYTARGVCIDPAGAGRRLVSFCDTASSAGTGNAAEGTSRPAEPKPGSAPEKTGGSVSYYTVKIAKPTTEGRQPYEAECNDIIEALGMNYAEGNAFKAIWRRAAARTLGKAKAGYDDGRYDAEKVEFFGRRLIAQSTTSEQGA